VIKLLRRIVFGSLTIGCSCLEFVTLGSAFLSSLLILCAVTNRIFDIPKKFHEPIYYYS
jgi:hypothetical protein